MTNALAGVLRDDRLTYDPRSRGHAARPPRLAGRGRVPLPVITAGY
jgi:hypothetical protein